MASFVITARANPPDATLMRALGDCVPGGIGHIADCLRSGAPLFEAELSGGPEQLARVRKLLAVLEGNWRRASWARYPFDPQCGLMIAFSGVTTAGRPSCDDMRRTRTGRTTCVAAIAGSGDSRSRIVGSKCMSSQERRQLSRHRTFPPRRIPLRRAAADRCGRPEHRHAEPA